MDTQTRPLRTQSDNVKLFAKHGPWWMMAAIVAERFPYKTALTCVVALWMRH